MEADQLDDGLLVGNHIQGVELNVDNLEVALLLLLQAGTVGAHQHHLGHSHQSAANLSVNLPQIKMWTSQLAINQ